MGEGVGEGGGQVWGLGEGGVGGRRWSVSGGRGGCVSAYVSLGECKFK